MAIKINDIREKGNKKDLSKRVVGKMAMAGMDCIEFLYNLNYDRKDKKIKKMAKALTDEQALEMILEKYVRQFLLGYRLETEYITTSYFNSWDSGADNIQTLIEGMFKRGHVLREWLFDNHYKTRIEELTEKFVKMLIEAGAEVQEVEFDGKPYYEITIKK